MKLTETKADMQGMISSVNGDDHFMNRITSIGITEGTAFQTVRNDRKMPVLIYLRETLISLNRADAERIEVTQKSTVSHYWGSRIPENPPSTIT